MAVDLLEALGEFPQEEEEPQAPTIQTPLNRLELIEAARTDLNLFAPLVMPGVFAFDFPPIYVALWQLLTSKSKLPADFSKLALGLPRGFAKSTFIKLFIAWLVLYSDRKHILVVCHNEGLAVNLISDVCDMLDEQNVKSTFGDWRMGIEKANERQKIFAYRGRTVNISAMGASGSPRGLNINNARPDVIVMDDIQKKEDAENLAASTKLYSWLFGTLLKTKANNRCLSIFVANMYPYPGSILRRLKHNKTWLSFITGAILSDGQSLWPELRSIESLIQEFKEDLEAGEPEIFFAEVLNDEEAGARAGVDVGRIPAFPVHLIDAAPDGGFIIIDLASGKAHGDDCVIMCVLLYDGVPVIRKLQAGKFTPLRCIEEALSFAFEFRISLIVAESGAYQSTFLFWFDWVCKQRSIEGIQLAEVHSQGLQKNARIKAWLPKLISSPPEILLHPDVRSAVVYEIVSWNPARRDNIDNIIDLPGYFDQVMLHYGHFTVSELKADFLGAPMPPVAGFLELQSAF